MTDVPRTDCWNKQLYCYFTINPTVCFFRHMFLFVSPVFGSVNYSPQPHCCCCVFLNTGWKDFSMLISCSCVDCTDDITVKRWWKAGRWKATSGQSFMVDIQHFNQSCEPRVFGSTLFLSENVCSVCQSWLFFWFFICIENGSMRQLSGQTFAQILRQTPGLGFYLCSWSF